MARADRRLARSHGRGGSPPARSFERRAAPGARPGRGHLGGRAGAGLCQARGRRAATQGKKRRNGVLTMTQSAHPPALPPNVHVIDHPLVQHKLSLMRQKDRSTSSFRSLLAEISMLLAYELTRDLALVHEEIETPMARMS